jgi:hypothetical protein
MAVKLKVMYLDGREVVAVASPRAQVMTEEKFQGITDAYAVRSSYYLAWASLHKSGAEPADYETWLDSIAEVEPVESQQPDPTTGTAPSPDGSSG